MIRQERVGTYRWFAVLFGLLAIGIGIAGGFSITQTESTFQLVFILIGILGVAATLVRLEIGLLVLVFMTYLRLSDIAIEFLGAPSILKPFLALLGAALALQWIRTGIPSPRGWMRAVAAVVIYGLVVATSLLYAENYVVAEAAVSDFIKNGIITILVTMMILRGPTLQRVVWALLAAGILMGSISVYQYLTHSFSNNYWGLGQANIQNIITGVEDYRISGPVGDPNFFAQVLVALVPLAFNQLLDEKRWILKLLAGWALAVCGLSILFTFSRGGAVALAVVLLGMLLYRRPRPAVILVLILLAVLLVRFLPETYTARLETIVQVVTGQTSVLEEVSIRGRTSELLVAWQMFSDHPVLGVGVMNYPVHYLEYSRRLGIDPRAENREPHNLFLEVAAETGLMGLLAFGLVLWLAYRGIWQAWSRLNLAGQKIFANLAAALGIGLTGYLCAALFIHGAYPRYFWLLIGITLALPQVANNILEGARQEVSEP